MRKNQRNAQNPINTLDIIKKYIEDGELSFLIGAGFSRNVNMEAYPLWSDLLKDATWSLFGKGDRAKLETKVFNEAVRNYGYLGIASLVVKKAGYHEAIDSYIESKTPYLKTVDGESVLFLKGKALSYPVNSECHLLLKKLNIQNIYTFNYDNALEYFMGEEARAELEDEIQKLEDEHQKLYDTISELEKKRERKENLEHSTKAVEAGADIIYHKNEPKEINDPEKDNKELENINSEIKEKQARFNEVSVNLDAKKLERKSFYTVVKDSYDISLSNKRKSIYKIHGSLRDSSESSFGFDSDAHTQYIITQEDYNAYSEKHSAFVNMMRIDLLRNRFCIMGVSGNDANFLTWINWVKDILDKAKDRTNGIKKEGHQSFFIYSGNQDIPDDLVLMLRNHFIEPVILKDIFPDSTNDEERIKRFLEKVQPLGNSESSEFSELWKKINLPRINSKQTESISKQAATRLFNLSSINKYHRESSIVHYISSEIQFAPQNYLGENKTESERKIYAAALQCSMLPLDLTCDNSHLGYMRGESVEEINEAFDRAISRSLLLQNIILNRKKSQKQDNYSHILQNLFDYKFPSKEEILDLGVEKGIDFVRQYSLMRLIGEKGLITQKCPTSGFSSVQEMVLAADWLRYIGYRDPALFSKVDEFKNQENYNTLYDYCQSYLKAMRRREEISTFGNVSKTIYLDKYTLDVSNAAVLLNSFVELGICFANYQFLSDNEWLEIVRALKDRYTEAIIFYSIIRNEKKNVLKAVAQKMMYDGKAREVLPIVLNNIITSLVFESTPNYIKGKMANFASEILPAVNSQQWRHCFLANVESILDCADKCTSWDITTELYGFVANALEYVNAKELRIKILARILGCNANDNRFEGYLNTLAISARQKLNSNDFSSLYDNYLAFTKKSIESNNQQRHYVVMNLLVLLNKDQKYSTLRLLEEGALKDAFMTESYVRHIQDWPELIQSFKRKFLKGQDLWNTGIHDNVVSIGGGNVSVSRIIKYLSLSENEFLIVYNNLKASIEKISIKLQSEGRSKEDKGWISSENIFRDVVIDMRLFLHNYKRNLKMVDDYKKTCDLLEKTYCQCFFGKNVFQLIADDELGRAIRRIMTETEIYGIENFRLEYTQIIGRIIAKKTKELRLALHHISWAMNHYKRFFNTDDFRKLFLAILDVYIPYFDISEDTEKEWDLIGCQKEVAESYLIRINKTLQSWGYNDLFWSKYKRIFYCKD